MYMYIPIQQITACTVVQAVVYGEINGKGQISTPPLPTHTCNPETT